MYPIVVEKVKVCYGEFRIVQVDDGLYRINFVRFVKGKPKGLHKGKRLFITLDDARTYVSTSVIMGFHPYDL